MSETIAAVVVTYNRKELLINCLEAIRGQTYKPDAIFIIDNKSNDGTPELLLEKNYISRLPKNDIDENQLILHHVSSLSLPNEDIQINYVRKYQNDGGAGGFYEGMKRAYEAGYDWIWMMDDDGIADKSQIMELIKAPSSYKYRNALVIDVNDKSRLSFGLKEYKKIKDINETNIIENEVNPFNGTFIHRQIPEKIGFIKKEMFIWGDEAEFTKRAKSQNIRIGTILSALHYHPPNKGIYVNVIPLIKKYRLVVKPKALEHIYYRNNAFNIYHYESNLEIIRYFILHLLYFTCRFNLIGLIRFIKYFQKGIMNNFK